LWLSWQKKKTYFEAKATAALSGVLQTQTDVPKSSDTPIVPSHIPIVPSHPKVSTTSTSRSGVTTQPFIDHSKFESAEVKEAQSADNVTGAKAMATNADLKEQLITVLDEAWEYLSGKDEESIFAEAVSFSLFLIHLVHTMNCMLLGD